MSPRIWVVTGCSTGFGLELAKIIVQRGDKVIATSRTPEKLAELESQYPNFTVKRLNQNEPLDAIKADWNAILEIHGTIDVLVSNAAYVQTGFLEESTPENDQQQFLANVFGPLNLYRAALPHFRQNKSGTLVTIGSMAAWFPTNGCNLYNASKAALRWVGIGLAEEVKHLNIKHCLIEPGTFRTSLLDQTGDFKKSAIETRFPDYKQLNQTNDATFEALHGAQLGNPVVGAEIMYEVITSTGRAEGRELPRFLPLGSDACDEIAKTATATLKDIDNWRAIVSQSDHV